VSKVAKCGYSGLLVFCGVIAFVYFSLGDETGFAGHIERQITHYVEKTFSTCTAMRAKRFTMTYGKLTQKHSLCGDVGMKFIYQGNRLDQATLTNLPADRAEQAGLQLLNLALEQSEESCNRGRTRKTRVTQNVDYNCGDKTIRFIRGKFSDGLFASVEYK
jgi:hypothetical protein